MPKKSTVMKYLTLRSTWFSQPSTLDLLSEPSELSFTTPPCYWFLTQKGCWMRRWWGNGHIHRSFLCFYIRIYYTAAQISTVTPASGFDTFASTGFAFSVVFFASTTQYMFHKYRPHSGPEVESNICNSGLLQAAAHPKVFPCPKIVRWCAENLDANRRGPHGTKQGRVLGILFGKRVIRECITYQTLMWKGINQTG